MANTRRNSHDTSKISTATTALSNTSPATSPTKGNAYPILDNPIFVHVNEQNNNTIIGSNNALTTTKPGMLNGLPEMFTDVDLSNHSHLNGSFINDDLYKSYVLGKLLITILYLARCSRSCTLFVRVNFFVWQFRIIIKSDKSICYLILI